MELKIIALENGYIQKIENFEELKKELSERTERYKNLIYSDEQMAVAKTDRASLRKLVEALESRRKEYKKHCLKPYEDFEKDIKTLVSLIDEPIRMIDEQVKGFEALQREEKKTNLECFFYGYNPFEWLKFEQILVPQWLNASYKTEKVVEEIQAKIEQIKKDLATLQNLPDFGFEAVEEYKQSLDLNKAISEGLRLSEMQKRKAEQEKQSAQTEKVEAPAEESPKMWVAFEALLSKEDAEALKTFFKTRGIKYQSIPQKEGE